MGIGYLCVVVSMLLFITPPPLNKPRLPTVFAKISTSQQSITFSSFSNVTRTWRLSCCIVSFSIALSLSLSLSSSFISSEGGVVFVVSETTKLWGMKACLSTIDFGLKTSLNEEDKHTERTSNVRSRASTRQKRGYYIISNIIWKADESFVVRWDAKSCCFGWFYIHAHETVPTAPFFARRPAMTSWGCQ